MRSPRLVWESRHDEDDLADLTVLIRRYLAQGGAHMSHRQVAQAERLTPLERALTPARH